MEKKKKIKFLAIFDSEQNGRRTTFHVIFFHRQYFFPQKYVDDIRCRIIDLNF